MADTGVPFHAHIYYDAGTREAAAALRERFAALREPGSQPRIRFVGRMADDPVGPHPAPQYEVHFHADARQEVLALIEATGLTALVHPLTDDDLADHTTLAHWIGEPLELDTGVLDPPGTNQGMPRFGLSDF
jgi:aromatic ring-cleaving dioxygenase